MKYIFAFILGCFIGNSFPTAHAETTILLGESRFTPQSDGTWYQDAFPHRLNMDSPSFGIRYDTLKDSNNWSYGIGYMYLGKVSSSAEAVALDGKVAGDGGYNSSTKSCNGPCWPLSHWYGQGHVQGIFGAVTKHYGNWAFEVGPYLYSPTWNENIPDWIQCRTCAPQNITVSSHPHWQVGPMVGIQYKKDSWSFNASAWQTQINGASRYDPYVPALYHNLTYNFSVGFSF